MKLKALVSAMLLFVFVISACDEESTAPETKTPVIESLSLDSAEVGDEVTISGRNFGDEKGTSIVFFNQVAVPDAGYVEWTDNLVRVLVPENATSGLVRIKVGDITSNGINLKIVYEQTDPQPPAISSVSPLSLKAGMDLSVNGLHFGDQQDSNYVLINGVQADEYSSWSNSKIVLAVPENMTAGDKDVEVVVGTMKSNSKTITITEDTIPKPVILNLSSDNVKHGETLTINGKNFGTARGINYVDFNGVQGNSYTNWSDNSISVVVPQTAQSGNIKVVVGALESNLVHLTIDLDVPENPIIDYLDSDIAQEGQAIGINGEKFGSTRGDSKVLINDMEAEDYLSWSDTRIIVKIPMGAKSGKVYVMVNDKKSNGADLTVQEALKVLDMVLIPTGSFIMGSDESSEFDDKPAHEVTITKEFYMSATEITQAEYKVVMNQANPSKIKNDLNPVEQVTWFQAVDFCNRLSELEGYTPCYTINGDDVSCNFSADGYRLATEAEWEYACRAGTTGSFSGTGYPFDMGWMSENSDNKIHTVAQKEANQFGLYDMHGNVKEWCWDWYEYEYYENSPAQDPRGPSEGLDRIVRGGSYQNGAEYCSANRRESMMANLFNYNTGFRVVRNK